MNFEGWETNRTFEVFDRTDRLFEQDMIATGTHGSQRQGSATIGWRMVMGGDDERQRKMWREKALTVIWTPALRRETVGVGVDSTPGWRMRQQQMEALLGAKPPDCSRAQWGMDGSIGKQQHTERQWRWRDWVCAGNGKKEGWWVAFWKRVAKGVMDSERGMELFGRLCRISVVVSNLLFAACGRQPKPTEMGVS